MSKPVPSLALALLAASAFASPGTAQDDPNAAATAEAARLNAQAGVANAEAARINAQAARDKARIDALGLPSFDGKTTLGTGAGAMEATMLTSYALAEAAEKIGARALAVRPSEGPPNPDFLLLAGEEALDFSQVGMLRTQMDAIKLLFDRANGPCPVPQASSQIEAAAVPPAIVTGAISAAAGLLRSDTEVTALDLPAISHRALTASVASRLPGRAVLPAAAIMPPDETDPLGGSQWANKSVLQAFNSLVLCRDAAAEAAKPLPKEEKDQTATQKQLLAAIARFDAFTAKATSPDAAGVVPLARVAQLDRIARTKPLVLRVFVEKAGGSLINSKNLATTLGLDPVKVSGGLIASYTITDPSKGKVLDSDVLTCRTTLSRLRPIQEGDWAVYTARVKQAKKAHCASILRPERSDS